MRAIIGYGNEIRGEDAFGIDVVKELQKIELKDTKLILLHQLTPEIVLELFDADEIVFIDTLYDEKNHYTLECSLKEQNNLNLSHHISPKTIIYMLSTLYGKKPKFFIYSITSSNFNTIKDKKVYKKCVNTLVHYLK